jgi:hypothetical protein
MGGIASFGYAFPAQFMEMEPLDNEEVRAALVDNSSLLCLANPQLLWRRIRSSSEQSQNLLAKCTS